ncbi:MAG: F0F1 ATP synthase subunit delta [Candidatus Komeilibacteria bacterium]|nr:F0F1 ATP synthase subunit delta [Candidatus Komeilibacteria bacterium]
MSRKVSSKTIATRFLAGYIDCPSKEQDGFLTAFVTWLYDRRYWRKRNDIQQAVKRVWYEQQGLLETQITTSAELPTETKQELTKALEKYFAKKIIAQFRVQPSLLGGLVVSTAEGQVISFTFQQLLNNLTQQV